ncbi:hypothetical protein KL86PLE_120035 [uncultured Pleomorphomonas sp.]|uniref:Uncharacterized protein n=1 Tax=uncultured Pleomorphomonas sp. TaxID=442121 RepID=A0A212L826_9HYPH|nr:hypothetical protein KL86PLE_120035 [uncultured Pleomorphomonas sp.]
MLKELNLVHFLIDQMASDREML